MILHINGPILEKSECGERNGTRWSISRRFLTTISYNGHTHYHEKLFFYPRIY